MCLHTQASIRLETIIGHDRILQEEPFWSQTVAVEQRTLVEGSGLLGSQGTDSHHGVDGISAIDNWPLTALPLDGSQTGLTAYVVVGAPEIAIGQKSYPPRTVRGIDKIAVAGTLNLHALTGHRTVGQ